MRSKLGFLFTAIALLLTGCSYDYGVGLIDYKPQVVINSIIKHPCDTIKVSLFWTKEAGSEGDDYKRVEGFDAKIYENDFLIFEGNNLNDSIEIKHESKGGAIYRIEVEVPDYSGIVSAQTLVPILPTADIKHRVDSSSRTHCHHFEINAIASESDIRSIMVRTLGLYESIEPVTSDYLYANNPFCDQFNVYLDDLTGNGTYHEYFIRIPYVHLGLAAPMSFFVEDRFSMNLEPKLIGYDDWGFPIYEDISRSPDYIALELIAPSEDYDRYSKSTYQQRVMGDTGIPIFNVIVPVHSNVSNGLGIFAGYSYITFKEKIEHDKK